MHHVTLIPGDGTGPELAEATRKCVDATGVKINWDRQECGIEVIEAQGKIPDSVFTSIRANKVALKAPITTPIGKGFRSVNVALRQELGLYACVRPCKTYKGVRSYFEKTKVDLIIVRENTEDLYAGVEFQAGQPKTAELIQFINSIATGKKIGTGLETTGVSIKPMSVEGCRNISRYAFDYAVKYGRKSVTSICKANIMKFTDGLWYDTSRAVATAYGAKYEDPKLAEGVKADPTLAGKVPRGRHQLHRATRGQHVHAVGSEAGELRRAGDGQPLRRHPQRPVHGLVGGLGVAPGANIGPNSAIFEATHGSAPKYKGQNKVNPTALILSGKLMLEHLGESAAAAKLERAVASIIEEGKYVTYDMKPDRNDPTAVGTREMADAICKRMAELG